MDREYYESEFIVPKKHSKMMLTCSDKELPSFNPFVSCDGDIYTDDELNALLQNAIDVEDYEWAADIRDELKRRHG